MGNLILDCYGPIKKQVIVQSPFFCMHNRYIQKNPHQIDAFLKAVSSLRTGGYIFADEVGLGKTIEAGLVLKYLIRSGKKNIIIATPASLRVQWQVELQEKFNIEADVLDNNLLKLKDMEHTYSVKFHKQNKPHIVITSYGFMSKFVLKRRFSDIKWDLLVVDEAHRMGKGYSHGAKQATALFNATNGIPKLLLTATPLQNDLNELYGLISYIDTRIFENAKVFNKKYIEGQQYSELRSLVAPLMQRTLRRDVAKDMHFMSRTCKTIDFKLSPDEKMLYSAVNRYVKNAEYGFPTQNKNLCILVIRKLLASSSFALVDTFTKINKRLKLLLESTEEHDSSYAFDAFFQYLDEYDKEENDVEDIEEEDIDVNAVKREKLEDEITQTNTIIELASRIKTNTKMNSLIDGVDFALKFQEEHNYNQKIVIFTESLRTQSYLLEALIDAGYDDEDIVLFNGNQSDRQNKKIFDLWRAAHPKDTSPRSIQFKHAMVDYFKNNGKIFISTDSGAEGLNLQFSNIIINYDLPWNPQKIEQRIGRCHRYGQEHNVLAINFLNSENEADKRVYEILQKKFQLFDGIFGASDEALGLLSGEMNFEKEVLAIYQECDTRTDFTKRFDKLGRKIDAKKSKANQSLKNVLTVTTQDEKNAELLKTKKEMQAFHKDLVYWKDFDKNFKRLDNPYFLLKENYFYDVGLGDGGYLFVGGLISGNKYIESCIVAIDSKGGVVSVPEDELIRVIEVIDDSELQNYKPNSIEQKKINDIYKSVEGAANYKYGQKNKITIDYNNFKIDNWLENKKELLNIEIEDQKKLIEEKKEQSKNILNFAERIDFLKGIKPLETRLGNLQDKYLENITKLEEEARKEKLDFAKSLEVNLIFFPAMILKF